MLELRFALAHGEFGKNEALWRVRELRFALSPWYTVGRVNADCASVISRRMNRTQDYSCRTVEMLQTISTIQILKKSEAFQRQLCIMNYEL